MKRRKPPPSLGEHARMARQLKGIRRELAVLTKQINAHYPVSFEDGLAKCDHQLTVAAERLDERMRRELPHVPIEKLDAVYAWAEGEGELFVEMLAREIGDIRLAEMTPADLKATLEPTAKDFTASLLGTKSKAKTKRV